ncbi:MAG: M48 family metallopeptidase [Campylobacterales bacterium]|nr:M48 family metallopeptidase [Campylobacterales bacterium]
MQYIRYGLLSLIITLFFAGCNTKAPITGRSQMIMISPQQELALGMQSAKEVLKKSKLSKNRNYINRVNRVGKKIAAASGQNYKWKFYVIDDAKTANAFVLPGGQVFFYTGILKYMSNDDEIAAVMAHEVGHALARHAAERISTQQLASLGGQILQIGLGANGVSTGDTAIMQAFGIASQLGVILPYSRTQEYEADHIGLVLAARAGYNPNGALTFWSKFMKNNSSRSPEYFSTHPNPQNRIARLKSLMPEVMPIYEKNRRR